MKEAVKLKVNSTLRLLHLRQTACQRPLVNPPSLSLLTASSPKGSHGVKNKSDLQIFLLLIASARRRVVNWRSQFRRVGQVSGNLRGDFPWPGLPCRPSDELEMMDFLSMWSEATQVYTIHLIEFRLLHLYGVRCASLSLFPLIGDG